MLDKITIILALLAPLPAIADPDALPLTYAEFEAAVPHFDLEHCPRRLAADATFCRATFNHEQIHVFAFSEEGDSVMTGFASYPSDGLGKLLH